MAIKCTLCLQEKGRRICPRKDNILICSKCCVELRKDFKCGDCKYYIQNEYSDFIRYMNNTYKDSEIFPDKFDKVSREISALIERKNIEKAQKKLTPLLNDNPDSTEFLFLQGTILSLQKKYEDAIKYLDHALEIYPYYREAMYNKAIIYIETMEVFKAITTLRRVIKFSVEEDYYVINSKRALSIIKDDVYKNHNLDLDSYVKSVKIYDVSFQKLNDKQYEEAIEGFKKVLLINVNHYQSYGNLGLCYAYLDNKDAALKYFKKALDIEPDYMVVKNNLNVFLSLKPGESFPWLNVKSVILKGEM